MQMTSLLRGGTVLALVCAACACASAQTAKVLASFDGPPPNELGGAYGVFGPPGDTACSVKEERDEGVRYGARGASMRLDYAVEKAGCFNGFWMKLGPQDSGNAFDASAYSALSLWVKGDPEIGFPAAFKIELKGDPGSPAGHHYVTNLNGDWQKIAVPLRIFGQQGVDLADLNEFVIVFEHDRVGKSAKGRLWIDAISLE